MDHKSFWRIIHDSKQESGGDTDAQVEWLQRTLETLPPEDIVAFDRIFTEYYFTSYRWDLWAAAYIINGGCSNDGFDYFRAGLIAQGEEVFTNALKDPETLADVIKMEGGELSLDSDWAAGVEEVLYVAMKAYEAKTRSEMPQHKIPFVEVQGEPWDEDQVEQVLPRLAKHCGY